MDLFRGDNTGGPFSKQVPNVNLVGFSSGDILEGFEFFGCKSTRKPRKSTQTLLNLQLGFRKSTPRLCKSTLEPP